MDTATRRGGVFLTPLSFAKKAYEYLERLIGEKRLLSGEYRLWDMAAGTGHLELFLPKKFLRYCYLSTLEHKDVDILKRKFPNATVFQYDYLNELTEPPFSDCDSANVLRNDLANPALKWIILVNPPYATAQEAGLKGTSKEGVSNTKIRKLMHAEGLGEVSRELYVQFLYRIMNEFKHRETLLGLFSPLKYLVSSNYQKFRDTVFQAVFQSGFIFSSENFGGTSKSSHFPVGFILWNVGDGGRTKTGMECSEKEESNDDHFISSRSGFSSSFCRQPPLQLDILDNTARKIGVKIIQPAHREDFLSRWIKRPRCTQIFPPFSSALTIKPGNTDTRNRIADGFLASLMCPGNELQNQQQTAFLSGPQASAGALSVTPENFEQAVVVFAARRIPKDSWVNHVDQLLRPNRELSPQFVGDCAVWSLFDSKNQTAAMRNVQYHGRVYQVVNHFFPFASLSTNSFVADWLAKQTLSVEAQNVLSSAEEIYRLFFANWDIISRDEFKIDTDDAGWYQIGKALRKANLGEDFFAVLKDRHDKLKVKILPQLYNYGIIASILYSG